MNRHIFAWAVFDLEDLALLEVNLIGFALDGGEGHRDGGHKPIEHTILVYVANGAAHPVSLDADLRGFGRILKSAVGVIPENGAVAEVDNGCQVRPAIAIEVGDAGRVEVDRRRGEEIACGLGDVCEVAGRFVAPVEEKPVVLESVLLGDVCAPLAYDDIEIAIPVDIASGD